MQNRLSAISRWKIFDNLRRSVVEIFQLGALVAGWALLPDAALQWTWLVLLVIAFPWLFSLGMSLIRPPRDQSWLAYYVAVGRDAITNFQQFGLAVVFLPHQAAVSADAIVRTLYRLWISHRNLLEWQTASQVERALGVGSLLEMWRKLWTVIALCLVLGILVGLHVTIGSGATSIAASSSVSSVSSSPPLSSRRARALRPAIVSRPASIQFFKRLRENSGSSSAAA
jgi:cyclic beta-1,2-glucan synthetase